MTLREFRRRVRNLFGSRTAERDLQEELAFHVDRETEALVASGLPREHAKLRARARFGSAALTADQCRDVSGRRHLTDVAADVRFALRQFRRRPGPVAAMIAVLAVGIGFSTAVFVLLNSLESAPPAAIARDDALVRIRGIDRSRGPGRAIGREFPYTEFAAHAAAADVFRDVAAWTSTDVVIDVGDGRQDLQSGAATYVTAGYFPVLGVHPMLGPGLPADSGDTAAPRMVALISHAIWDRFYDRSPAVVGRTMKVNGETVAIVGVAPPRFVGARTGGSVVRVWLPLNTRPVLQRSARATEAATFGVIARLRDGVSHQQATAVADAIASRPPDPADRERRGSFAADVVPVLAANYFPPSGEPGGGAGKYVALSIPLLVLLITTTSVSALVAGLSLARRREMAVRLAMGAHRWRIVRQLMTESALLGLSGGALALLVLWWLATTVEASVMDVPMQLDWRAAAFAGALGLLATALFGLSPALHATRMAVADVLKEADFTASRTRLQAGLVVAQIALTQPALLGMGALLLRLRSDLQPASVSTIADRVIDVRFNTNPRYGALDARREEAIKRVQARLAELPVVSGVVAQGINNAGGMVSAYSSDRASGSPGSIDDPVAVQPAPAGFFDVMGIPIVQGRAPSAAEQASRSAVVVDAGLARRLWGGADAIGRRLVIDEPDDARNGGVFTVVGVARETSEPRIYMPGMAGQIGHLLVRTHGPGDAAMVEIRAAALNEAPDHPVVSSRTLAAIEGDARRSTVQGIMAAGASGLLALGLAAIGLYAVVSVAVGQRRREIGVRAALGAGRRRLVLLFAGRGVRLCLLGAVIGLALSAAAVRGLAALEGDDPPSGVLALSVGVTIFVMAVAVLAAWIPARRATAIDPLAVLRAE